MRKAILEKRQARLVEKINSLKARALSSTDAAEVRSINEMIEDINADLSEIREELSAIEAEEARAAAVPQNAGIAASFSQNAQPQAQRSNENPLESLEYRSAFHAYITQGAPMPAEYRGIGINDEMRAAITTGETGPAIPLTIMREVINTVRKRYGNLYDKVLKVSVPGGVDYAVGDLQATFKWITEGTVSPEQDLGQLGTVSFRYFTAEIRIAQTFLSRLVTLSDFETKITEVIAVAYRQAMDIAIVRGVGEGQPLGILNDSRVTKSVTMTAAQLSNWTHWRKEFFAKLPLGYRDGEFIFPLSTVDAYLETMQDANGNPIFRQATGLEVNDGDSRNPSGRFFGRDISLVEPDVLPDFDAAASGDVIGIFWQPDQYVLNENFGFTMFRYFDHDTNRWIDKALCVVDGKPLNPTGYVLIKKA